MCIRDSRNAARNPVREVLVKPLRQQKLPRLFCADERVLQARVLKLLPSANVVQ